jgi:UDP-glucuronate 4-epimerase
MALYKFADAIVGGQPIKLFNHGNMRRDFTYVDDVIEAVIRLIDHVPQGDANRSGDALDPGTSSAPWRIYNIGNNKPAELMSVVALLEKEFGRTAQKEMLPMQPGDVQATFADIDDLTREVGFRPLTPLEDGIHRFATWYCRYHQVG